MAVFRMAEGSVTDRGKSFSAALFNEARLMSRIISHDIVHAVLSDCSLVCQWECLAGAGLSVDEWCKVYWL